MRINLRRFSIWSVDLDYRFKVIFFLVSVIPMAIMTYLAVEYVFPLLSEQHKKLVLLGLSIVVYLVVFVSVMGYLLLHKSSSQVISQLRSQNKQLFHLFNIAKALSSTIHLDVLLQSIVDAAVEVTGSKGGLLFLHQPDDEKLMLRVVRGKKGERMASKKVKLGEGIAGLVALKKEALVLNEVVKEKEKVQVDEELLGIPVQSVLSVPLVFQEKLVGVVEILNKKGGFTEEDKELLTVLGSQAVIFIRNVEMMEAQHNYFIHITEILIKAMENYGVWEGHLKNVARWSDLITRKLALPEEERRDIHFAALLHDIGIIWLGPTSKLKESMKREHPIIGEKVIRPITIWRKVAPLILYHHEHYDGKGYPYGIKGEQIPLGARIISVTEAYDTMTNIKSYNRKPTIEEAKQELIDNAGTQFDPAMVKVFLQILKEES